MSRAARSDLHDVTVIYQTRTEKAVCVRVDEDGADIWIPIKSCEIEPMRGASLQRGGLATLTASEGVLIEKGLV